MTKPQDKKNNLFSDFPPVSRKEWEELITQDLKGADYREKLSWDTLEGFKVLPFFRSDDMEPKNLSPMGMTRSWKRCESVHEPDPSEANTHIKKAVAGGTNSISIKCRITPNEGALGGDITGTKLETDKDFKNLTRGVNLVETHLFFDSGMCSPAMLALFLNHASPDAHASFLFDPFTYIAQHGRLPFKDHFFKNLVQQLSGHSNLKTLAADGLFYQQAGATIIQEIGISLAIACEYLSLVEKNENPAFARSFFVRLSAGPLYFPEIAKNRAIRILWKQLLEAFEIDNSIPLWIHSETTRQNKTVTDPHTNMLRATTEAMAAILGGTNSLVIHPYDSHFKEPTDFSNRMARNVHHILEQESYLGKTSDPAAGSYYLEKLTDTIAEKSWDFFREIEGQGGFRKSLENRFIQTEIGLSKTKKENAYAERKKILVGTNQYPNPDEDLPDVNFYSEPADSLASTDYSSGIQPEKLIKGLQDAFRDGAALGDLTPQFFEPQAVLYPALKEYRAGSFFEEIRLQTKQFTESSNSLPVAAIIPVGHKKLRKARATFTANYLGCAGFRIEQPIGFETLQEAEEQLKDVNADMYILCSSDKEYPDLVPEFTRRFSEKTHHLLLAGNPGEHQKEYADAGIQFFIYSESNLPETLRAIQKKLFSTVTPS